MRRLVSYGPLTFAFDSRRYCAIASITSSGTCDPPGASKEHELALEGGEPGADGGDVETHAARFSHAARSSPSRSGVSPALPVHSGTSRAVSASGRKVSPAATARSTGTS